jgi:glutamine amidotransferase
MISIVDYQMGNLRSVQKAFEKVGVEAEITSDPEQLRKAEKIVVPGVGAFEDAIAELHRRSLVEPICESIKRGTPFLGICLGLQLLFDVSHEGGRFEGMGVIPGEVVRFQDQPGVKIPHMGWNQAVIRRPVPLLKGIDEGSHFYFVHSYYVVPTDQSVVAVECDYHQRFCAMIWRDNIFATQFHPEKSQHVGLQMLKNFAEYTG